MKKKGFTLIELIATVVIIGLMAVIIVPSIGKVIKKTDSAADKQMEANVILAAKNWATDNKNLINKLNCGRKKVTWIKDDLQEKGYIDKNLIIPSTKEAFTKQCIGITKVCNGDTGKSYYQYEYLTSEQCQSALDLVIIATTHTTNMPYNNGDESTWTNEDIDLEAASDEVQPPYSWYEVKSTGDTPISIPSDTRYYSVNTSTSKVATYKVTGENKGKTITSVPITIKIDKVAPVITTTTRTAKTNNLTITLTDSGSGVDGYAVTQNTNTPSSWTTYSSAVTLTKASGTYYVHAKDKAGNKTYRQVTVRSVDPPTCTLTINGTKGQNDWYKTNVTVNMTVTNSPTTKGLATTKNSTNGKVTVTHSAEGSNIKYYGYVSNEAGSATCEIPAFKIDKTAPSTPTITLTHSWNNSKAEGSKAVVYSNNTWINKEVYMTDARRSTYVGPTSTDATSGIARYEISNNNSTWVTYSYNYNNTMYVIKSDGTSNRYFRAIDKAGNVSAVLTRTVKRDTVAPNAPTINPTHSYDAGKAQGSKASLYNNNTWINREVYMTDARRTPFTGPSSSDNSGGSGIARYEISTNNSSWVTYSYNYNNATYVIKSDGTSNRYFRAVDNAGNVSAVTTKTVKRDTVAPGTPSLTMTHSYDSSKAQGKKATVYSNSTWINKNIYMIDARYSPYRGPSSSDATSGIARYEISTNKSSWSTYSYDSRKELYIIQTEGTSHRYFRAIDNAGNVSGILTKTVKLDKTNPKITVKSLTRECHKTNGGKRYWARVPHMEVSDSLSGIDSVSWKYWRYYTSTCGSRSSGKESTSSFSYDKSAKVYKTKDEYFLCGGFNRTVKYQATAKDKAGNKITNDKQSFITNQSSQGQTC